MRALFLAVLAAVLSGCAHPGVPLPGAPTGTAGDESARYAAAGAWLCRPDLPNDPCRSADLSAAVLGGPLAGSGYFRVDHAPAATAPAADCFYVYPTVDFHFRAQNHDDFSDLQRITGVTLAQVGRFRTLCRMFVPLYRQVSLGTYRPGVEDRERYFALAASDVESAFRYYLTHENHGRRVILIGHSQGAEMISRLLRSDFDGNASLTDRLVVALVVGGQVSVKPGQRAGGTFPHLPLCATRAQTGCVVAYRSYAEGLPVDPAQSAPPAGQRSACVNPAGPDDGTPRPLRGTLLPTWAPGLTVPNVATPYVLVPDAYAGRCVSREDGFAYLSVSEIPNAPAHPVDLRSWRLRGTLGLHVLDFQLPQLDLLALVKEKLAAR